MLNTTTKYFNLFPENNCHVQQQKSTRQIARVSIHVERAIERLKAFMVFQGNLSLTLAKLADQMLIVCGGLYNLVKPLAR